MSKRSYEKSHLFDETEFAKGLRLLETDTASYKELIRAVHKCAKQQSKLAKAVLDAHEDITIWQEAEAVERKAGHKAKAKRLRTKQREAAETAQLATAKLAAFYELPAQLAAKAMAMRLAVIQRKARELARLVQ